MLLSLLYQLVLALLGALIVLCRREVSKDAELLVLRHENAVLRREITRGPPTKAGLVELAERRAAAVRLRMSGMQLNAIAEELGYNSAPNVSRDISRAIREIPRADTEELVAPVVTPLSRRGSDAPRNRILQVR